MIRYVTRLALIAAVFGALALLTGLDQYVARLLAHHPLWLGGIAGVALGLVILLHVGELG